jgi:DnaJ-class molecular chaperone
MSNGPGIHPGPSTCERCGRPASSALFDTDGTAFYCPACLAAITAPCPACGGLGLVRQLDDDYAHICPACYGTGRALEETR